MRNHCRISTPKEYVETMLDLAGYTDNLYGKTVLENSCGEGNILVEIIRRYVVDCQRKGYRNDIIINGVLRDINAYEIDNSAAEKCKERIKELGKELNIKDLRCNIHIRDYLETDLEKYDFILGNPPYVTYHDLTVDVRNCLREKFDTCKKGRFDYCYAFIEKSVMSLNDRGVLVYLIPFSIFRNKFAQSSRDLLLNELVSIVDYSGIPVFDSATVTAAVVHVIKGTKKMLIDYTKANTGEQLKIEKAKLSGKWFFKNDLMGKRFGDLFYVQNSVATLCNEAFLIKQYEEEENFIIVGDKKIEKDIIRDAVSTKSCKKKGKRDKIIFPYRNSKNGYERIPKNEFMQLYPRAVGYLQQFEKKLENRKSSNGVEWYEYGRTQALGELYGKKLIVPAVITTKLVAYKTDDDTIPYAGFFIKAKDDSEYDLDFAKNMLESPLFYEYVKQVGTPTTETSYRISVKEIENYTFMEE